MVSEFNRIMSFCKIQYIGNEVLEMAKLRDKIVGYISPKQRKLDFPTSDILGHEILWQFFIII